MKRKSDAVARGTLAKTVCAFLAVLGTIPIRALMHLVFVASDPRKSLFHPISSMSNDLVCLPSIPLDWRIDLIVLLRDRRKVDS